jgi:hypothetical protein
MEYPDSYITIARAAFAGVPHSAFQPRFTKG